MEGEANPLLQQDLQGLQPLQKSETFRVVSQPGDRRLKWYKGEVEEQADVRTEDSRMLCRSSEHLCSSRELFPSTLSSELPKEIPSLCQPSIRGKFPRQQQQGPRRGWGLCSDEIHPLRLLGSA